MHYVLAINVHEKGIIFRFKLVSRMGSSKSHDISMLTSIYICSSYIPLIFFLQFSPLMSPPPPPPPPRSLHQKAERFHSHAEEFKVLQHERCFYTNFLYASLRKFIFIFQTQVWLKVWKVISKMLEENEKFRHRLLTCSQFSGESK
uniref:Uncharacterized protein n=1 Tax=Gallus gallus TaxID=9031 RepID=A0A8V0YAC9_CHICK